MSEWYPLLIVLALAAGVELTVAVFAGRWLLTGRRPWFMRRATRFSAYLIAAVAGSSLVPAIVLPIVVTRSGHRYSHTSAVLSEMAIPLTIAVAICLMYLADRRGRARRLNSM
jgi:hypothetical protein